MRSCLSEQELERFRAGELSDALCGEIEQHLAECAACQANEAHLAMRQDAFLGRFRAVAGADDTPLSPARSVSVPERIGRYRIIHLIGEGGMGAVYAAEQDQPKRIVALKVIKPGLASSSAIKRFEQESLALGRLQHPCIAQVFEAGTYGDGQLQRYFAMEYVAGTPLTAYCERERLSVHERLELAARIADAVQHAHNKGIIHRDLKPANILVADGSGIGDSGVQGKNASLGGSSVSHPPYSSIPQPKILDFGVARLIDRDQRSTAQTDAGVLVGTLAYMSPEQVAANPDEVDTRSDVYSLGVVLYELLTAQLPYETKHLSLHEVVRVIREQEPARPTAVRGLDRRTARELRGDVETIVLKALEKDRERRYQTAAALAADIRRFLADEPIAARPASSMYQLRKLARRHTGVVVGAALALFSLAAGTVVASVQAIRATRAEGSQREERRRAERARDEALRVTEFLSQTLASADPMIAVGRDRTLLREMMDLAAGRIARGEMRDAPQAELRLRLAIGKTYRSLGEFDAALELLNPALVLAEAFHGIEHAETATALDDLGVLEDARGNPDRAEELTRRALAIRRKLLPADDPVLAISLNNLGGVLAERGKLAEAEPLLCEALDIRTRRFGENAPTVAHSINTLAGVIEARGGLREAEVLYRRAHRIFESATETDERLNVAMMLLNRGNILHALGELAPAEEMLRRAERVYRALLGDSHWLVAKVLNGLGGVLMRRGDLTGAEAAWTEALEIRRAALGPDHPEVAMILNNLSDIAAKRGDHAAAEAMNREALAIRRARLGDRHPLVAMSLHNLSFALLARDNVDEALAMLREAVDIQRAIAAQSPALASCLNGLGRGLLAQHDIEGAEAAFRESLAMRRSLLGDSHREVAVSRSNLAQVLRERGELAAGRAELEEALRIFRARLPADHPELAAVANNLGQLMTELCDFAAAEPLLREALDIRLARLPSDHPDIAATRNGLGLLLLELRRFDEAEQELVPAWELVCASTRATDVQRRGALESLVRLYEERDAAESGQGHDARAAELRALLAVEPPMDADER
ncbi:MAG: Serine/threonine-protein kinase PknD [Phycisphaerae bacterium]|nr:Serine/threonine-protein kinase PknD [Phycisphaerae bacterium]